MCISDSSVCFPRSTRSTRANAIRFSRSRLPTHVSASARACAKTTCGAPRRHSLTNGAPRFVAVAASSAVISRMALRDGHARARVARRARSERAAASDDARARAMDGLRASRRIRMRKQYDVCFRIYVCANSPARVFIASRASAPTRRRGTRRRDATRRRAGSRRTARKRRASSARARGGPETRDGDARRRTGDASVV